MASDGETYERAAIEKWIAEKKKDIAIAKKENHDTNGKSKRAKRILAAGVKSPLGIGQIQGSLLSNRAMKRRADQWREANE